MIQKLASGNVGAFRFAAGAAVCEAEHVQAHARKPNCKDEDADDANGQFLNHDVYMEQFVNLSTDTWLRDLLIIVPFWRIHRVIQNSASGNVGAFRFAAGAAVCEAEHVQAHARKPNCKDEDADDANGQFLNHDVYNAHSLHLFIDGLINDIESLKSANAQILFICNSQAETQLQSSLEKSILTLEQLELKAELLMEDKNENFVHLANRGLREAMTRRMDALLLDPEAILTPGVTSELRAVCETDSMIAFVSPRSNQGHMSSIGLEDQKNCSLIEGKEIHTKTSHHLPRCRYVPGVEEFCLYIRYPICVEFGLLNEINRYGNNEEFDLVMNANRAGYRAALANHAYVHQHGNPAKESKEKDRSFSHRFPEYQRMAYQYRHSAEYIEENIRSRCVSADHSISLLFDLSNVGMFRNGTIQHAVNVVKALPRGLDLTPSHVVTYVSIDEKLAHFYGIDCLENIRLVPVNTTFSFDAVVRIGQPWEWNDLIRLANLAPVNVIFMLDTIAWDCGYTHTLGLDDIWKIAFQTLNGVLYNSEFTRHQFLRRFGVEGQTCLLSTDPTEYKVLTEEINQNHLLIVGNHHLHKAIPETVKLLSEFFPERKIIAIGTDTSDKHNVQVIPSGHLSDDLVHRLYKEATEIIYPSHYEGFGFPVIQSLAYGKKIFARRTPLLMEIAKRCPRPDLIIPFDVLNELPQLIASPKSIAVEPGSPRTWTDHASDILHYMLKLCAAPDVNVRFRNRLSLLYAMQSMSRTKTLEEELEKIYQSKSWKMITHLRRIKQLIMPK